VRKIFEGLLLLLVIIACIGVGVVIALWGYTPEGQQAACAVARMHIKYRYWCLNR
jgi:hypothetical protein